MPELGSHDSCDDGKGDHGDGVGLEFSALESAIHEDGRSHSSAPEHEAEGRNGESPEVEIRKHTLPSIAAGAAQIAGSKAAHGLSMRA